MATKKEPSLGERIDKLYAARAKRIDLDHQVQALKKEEAEERAAIIKQLRSVRLESGRGKLATATIVPSRTVTLETPESWAKYWAWARKDKLGVYVHKRVSVEAVLEQVDAGKDVPGIKVDDVVDLSLAKAAKA